MVGRRLVLAGVAAVLAVVAPWAAPVAAAQNVFGTHTWQMQPFCNVVTLTLSPAQGGARVEGFDNLCGTADRASAVGMASQNANGGVTLNFTVVTNPDARPVHVTAVVNLQSGGGTWIDSAGNSGAMAYGAAAPGPVRPIPVTQLGPDVVTTLELAPGAVRLADINTTEVQARVTGACPAGQAMSGINANGTVACTSIVGGGGGGSNVAFKAGGNALGAQISAPVYVDVPWTSTRFNTGPGSFNGTAYTVPEAGLYLMTTSVPMEGAQATGMFCGAFRVNGDTVGLSCQHYVANANTGTPSLSLSTTAQLSAGDTVVVSVLPLGATVRISGSNFAESNFTVTKLQ
ncbi:MAG: hypothetical protein IT180_18205 [Acidobacteria bacterium]|nr:hypothetical protein [Acidobacteriota bacterium]